MLSVWLYIICLLFRNDLKCLLRTWALCTAIPGWETQAWEEAGPDSWLSCSHQMSSMTQEIWLDAIAGRRSQRAEEHLVTRRALMRRDSQPLQGKSCQLYNRRRQLLWSSGRSVWARWAGGNSLTASPLWEVGFASTHPSPCKNPSLKYGSDGEECRSQRARKDVLSPSALPGLRLALQGHFTVAGWLTPSYLLLPNSWSKDEQSLSEREGKDFFHSTP